MANNKGNVTAAQSEAAIADAASSVPVNEAAPENASFDMEAAFAEKMAEFEIKAQEKADEIIEEAKIKAEEIIADAASSVPVKAAKEVDPYLEERVTVELFRDSNRYKAPVLVSVNGENCLIKRGEKVQIKRKFALALEQSLSQDEYAAIIKDGLAEEYEAVREKIE